MNGDRTLARAAIRATRVAVAVCLWMAGSVFLAPDVAGADSGGGAAQAGPGNVLRPAEPVAGQYIVELQPMVPGTDDQVSRQLARGHGGVIVRNYHHALHGFVLRASDADAMALSRDPRVKLVAQDGVVHTMGSQSPAPSWGLDRIDQRARPLDNTYGYGETGAGVHAYIIDTGIRVTHQDFAGRVSIGDDEIGDGQNGNDCNGHGTHVAGTVGGTKYGVAKNVTLTAVRVLDCSGAGEYSRVIAGVDWVTANHLSPAVANMSLGGAAFAPLDTAVQQSIASGVSYVVAAGNSGADACSSSPSDTPAALTVGATDTNDARPSFSNFGACVDLFAPGVNIASDWNTGDTAAAIASGTSMATPHVTGTAALYLEANPNATPAQVASALTANATPGVVFNAGSGSPNLLDYAAFVGSPVAPVVAAVGSPTTESLMDVVLAGTGAVNVHARQSPSLSVVNDSFCGVVAYNQTSGSGVVASPNGSDAGRDALRGAVAGSYPDATADVGKGCVDVARSAVPPRAVSASGDNATFQYYGYALDAVTWATSSSSAPPSLTQAQVQGIFKCTFTDWSQVGGSAGHITRVLPEDGSETLTLFLSQMLGVATKRDLPAGTPGNATGCTPILQQRENQNADLFASVNLTGADPPFSNNAYDEAIFPYAAGRWIAQAELSLDPTIDLRAGARLGALRVAQGSTVVAVSAVRWTGSTWQPNNATVVGDIAQVHSLANLSFTAGSSTVTATGGAFGPGDVGKTIDSPDVYLPTTITAVAGDGSSATIVPAAKFTGTANAAIGAAALSEATIAATSGAVGPFPAVHYLYNVIDSTEPSYNAARDLVGFQDSAGGAKSALCDGTRRSDISSYGFLPLAPRTTPGGNISVTCVKQVP